MVSAAAENSIFIQYLTPYSAFFANRKFLTELSNLQYIFKL